MASDQDFVEFVCDQASEAGEVTYRKMFGEYAVYLDGKVVALICDNQLFVKPTQDGRALLSGVVEAPPYPGAKNYFLIADRIEDRELLGQLFVITAREVSASKKKPRPRKNRQK